MRSLNLRWLVTATILLMPGLVAHPARAAEGDACTVKELKKSPVQGLKVYAPDGRRYVINKEDGKKVGQMYVGDEGSGALTCITCEERPGGPRAKRLKMQPHWHPSGKWIFLAAEREKYSPAPILGLSRAYVEGQLQSGLFVDMYAVSPDGQKWVKLTSFKSGAKGTPDGYTGPSFTPDGKKAVWSQIIDGNIFKYFPFGRWELIVADYDEHEGLPRFQNLKNITPAGMHWNEPGNFTPDGQTMLLSGSTEKDQQGMDQYLLNITTGALKNLTNSPKIWDEHGLFSPDGKKIMWMSSYPYRDDKKSATVTGIKTEFMLMNADGTDYRQLTHFRQPGHPEYPSGIAANPEWHAGGQDVTLLALINPKFDYWDLKFQGPCGQQ